MRDVATKERAKSRGTMQDLGLGGYFPAALSTIQLLFPVGFVFVWLGSLPDLF